MIEKKTPDFLHLLLRDLTKVHIDKGFSELEAAHLANKLIEITKAMMKKYDMSAEELWDKDKDA